MHFLHCIVVLFLFYASHVHSSTIKYDGKEAISKTITVDISGHGEFTSVQQAINSVPSNNGLWTRILVKPGVYNEKVFISRDKTRIFLDGENSATASWPVIQWGDGGKSIDSSTFWTMADNFVARNIVFKNTYNQITPPNGNRAYWAPAPAATIAGDKASFYSCSFIGLQDTLTDNIGRHYFKDCYIEGAVDFIWGGGQSIYQNCVIHVVASRLGRISGYITAQGLPNTKDESGFVFVNCNVKGSGTTYLGRAYGAYSRVLFYKSYLSNIIVPVGWSSWTHPGQENLITFSEVGCYGPGADMSKRVPWEKKLSPKDYMWLTNPTTFINTDGWLEKQPTTA